jgi:hypothetical protein
MIFEHIKCPLNKYTFKVKVIREWVEKNCNGLVLNLFAGMIKLNIVREMRNDIDPLMLAEYHLDAVDFLEQKRKELIIFDTIILDLPYAYRKSMEFYHGHKNSRFKIVKDLIYDVTRKGSRVITFGYHSVSMGIKRGFEIESIALFSHGGAIHDTIATVERKVI